MLLVDGHPYVYDWEYAEEGLPLSNDLIHFLLNTTPMRRQPASKRLNHLFAVLPPIIRKTTPQADPKDLAIIYLLTLHLRQIERNALHTNQSLTWDGEVEGAKMLDILLRLPAGDHQ